MKKLYDMTFVIEMSEKQYLKLCREEAKAERAVRDFPEWNAGLAATGHLHDLYGVRARLVNWRFGRNRDDIARKP